MGNPFLTSITWRSIFTQITKINKQIKNNYLVLTSIYSLSSSDIYNARSKRSAWT